MINRGKVRLFQVEQLVRVLDEPAYKLYRFGMNRKGEIVFMAEDHSYVTRTELPIIQELGHKLAQAVELRHVRIDPVGPDTITTMRLKRERYLMEIEKAAEEWAQ